MKEQKNFHLYVKLFSNCLLIDEVFKSRHQSVMKKIKTFVSKNWAAETILEHSIYVYKSNCIVA